MKKEAKAQLEGEKKFTEISRKLNKIVRNFMKVNKGTTSDEKNALASIALETAYNNIQSLVEYIELEARISTLNDNQKDALKELLNK